MPGGKEKVSQELERLSMLGPLWVGGGVVVDMAPEDGHPCLDSVADLFTLCMAVL